MEQVGLRGPRRGVGLQVPPVLPKEPFVGSGCTASRVFQQPSPAALGAARHVFYLHHTKCQAADGERGQHPSVCQEEQSRQGPLRHQTLTRGGIPVPDRLTGGCCEKIEDALAETEDRNKWHLPPDRYLLLSRRVCEWTSDCGVCMDKQRDARM